MRIYESVNSGEVEVHPYVWTLANGLKEIDPTLEFEYGFQTFWNDGILSCDIVHIHWPEKILCDGMYDSEQLLERLRYIKSKGIKVVSTAHNLEPHLKKNEERRNAYNVVYGESDVIFHLGEFSLSLMSPQYPNARHELIIHHVYDQIHKIRPTRSEALSYLGLNPDFKYLLCFGTFRNDEERRLVLNVYKEFGKKGIKVIAPGIAVVSRLRRNVFVVAESMMRYVWYRIRYPHLIICRSKVPSRDIPYYYAAADVSFIHRVSILNSGNLPMALLFGKIVAGPDLGNVGPQLRALGNPVFNPVAFESVFSAVKKAFELPDTVCESNRKWAMENMLTAHVAKQVLNCYNSIV